MEDETGLVDVVLFPERYQKWGRETSGARFLAATGRVMDDAGSITIEGERVERVGIREWEPRIHTNER
jgi:DNA polymerase III alpha subunit